MSSHKATESFCFVHTTQYIYEEDNKSTLERLGQQVTFKFRALWSVRDGKGLNRVDEYGNIFLLFSYSDFNDVQSGFKLKNGNL